MYGKGVCKHVADHCEGPGVTRNTFQLNGFQNGKKWWASRMHDKHVCKHVVDHWEGPG